MSETRIATRRSFLTHGLGLIGVGAALPDFLIRTALGASGLIPEAGSGEHRILVLLELSGGNDGPSALVPFAMDGYHKLRKTTRIPTEEVIKLNDELGLHPNLKGFREMLDQRSFAAIPGVGYPNPNYSHFEAMDIYHVADPRGKKITARASGLNPEARWALGWIGRYCDYAFKDDRDPKLSLAVTGGVAPVALVGNEHPGLSFNNANAFRFRGERGDARRAALYQRLNEPAAAKDCVAELDYVTHTAISANSSSEKIRELAGRYKTDITYPTSSLANSLRSVAGLISGKLCTRVYFVRIGGFDTHSEQKPQHDRLMADLCGAVTAFYKDLAAQGNAARVLTMTFSEFGRRPEENASRGTDHGSAGPMFLFGPMVKPGMHGQHPSYEKLNPQNNFIHTTDFRNVYAAVLEKWLGVPSQAILGENFVPVDCIR
jgi:uncharacterized protein (DUF1501 family)